MTTETNTISAEISAYTAELQHIVHKLKNFQSILPESSMVRADADTTIIAIDGILNRLQVPDLCNNINLPELVQLTDDIKNVQISASRILSKKASK